MLMHEKLPTKSLRKYTRFVTVSNVFISHIVVDRQLDHF